MPFGLQPIHLVVVAIAALLIFGPARLPEIGRGVGRAITEFRRGAKEMTETFMDEVNPPEEGQAAQSTTSQPADVQTVFQPPISGGEPVQANGSHPAEASVPVSGQSVVETAAGNFCIHCGKSNPAGAIYCNQCGQKIAE